MGAVRGGKGGSAIVFGQEEDGRSAVVERALAVYGQGGEDGGTVVWLS